MVALLQSELIPQIPIDEWVNSAVGWIIGNFGGSFEVLNGAIEVVVNGLAALLTFPPPLLMIAILAVIAFFLSGWRIALFTVVGLLFVISLGSVGRHDADPGAYPGGHDRLLGGRDTDRHTRVPNRAGWRRSSSPFWT